MNIYHCLGVMTGTSLDGLDLVFCHFIENDKQWSFEIIHTETIEMDPVWHDRLFLLGEQSAEVYAKTNVYFGHFLGKSIREFLDRNGLRPQLVACHGQTIFHQPGKNFTAQIGDGETMASYLECPVVTNFRNKNVAMGGQGAPLVPFGEKHLWPDLKLFLNLGGFANMTYDGLAFDICGCNLVLNKLVNMQDELFTYDHEGRMARSGVFSGRLFQQLEELDYYQKAPPKSLGREWLIEVVLPLLDGSGLPFADQMHTYARHIAAQIKRACQKVKASDQQIMITGGGTHNVFLLECIQNALESSNITLFPQNDDRIIDMKEAIIFGFLGLMTMLGKTNISAAATGATRDMCGGSIHFPPGGWGAPLVRPH